MGRVRGGNIKRYRKSSGARRGLLLYFRRDSKGLEDMPQYQMLSGIWRR